MANLHKSRYFIWGLFVIFCIVWFYTLGSRTLIPTDEGRYAEMAREMATTNDWITPRLNGIKYFEKPPLQIWMTALAFETFGLGEWQARLWTGLCGLLGILLTAYAGRRVFDWRIGFSASLVLASSFLWAALGHVNTLDMGVAGMMTVALCGLLLGQRNDASPREQRNWMLVCWTGMALSVLSKGLIGLALPGAVLVLYTLLSRDWAIWKRLHFGPGLLLFFAIVTPWFVLVSFKNPEFPQFFFIHEHFQRFTSKVHHRAGPWYYFIPILVLGILPWLGVLVQSLWAGRRDAPGGFQPKKLLLVWAGFIFFFFSISGSKLPSYILPIFPALALLIAAYLPTASRKSWAVTAGLTGALGAAGLALAPRISNLTSEPLEVLHYKASQPWIVGASAILLAGSLYVLFCIRQKRNGSPIWITIVLAASAFIAGQLVLQGTEPQGRYRAGLALVAPIEAELSPNTKLYMVGLYDQTLPFYLRRTMTLVEHADELAFGLQQEPELWLPTMQAFLQQWATKTKAIAITRHEIFAELEKQGIPMRIIAQDSRRIVITNDLENKAMGSMR
jgi:4-amino-4-deoxy-L-arabinose transferase-like glycosyltransferase